MWSQETTNIPGLFGEQAGTVKLSSGGQDVSGVIDGEIAFGEGQYLYGPKGSRTDGLIVRYDKELGNKIVDIKDEQGRVVGQRVVQQTYQDTDRGRGADDRGIENPVPQEESQEREVLGGSSRGIREQGHR